MTTASDEPPRDSRCCDGTYCHGKKRDGSGTYCHRPPGWGTSHVGIGACKLHGGGAESHAVAARAVQARKAVDTYGLPREVDPAVALLEEVHRSAGHVAWLHERVREIDAEDLVWGVVEEVDKGAGEFTGTDITSAAKPNIWLELYQQERKHLTAVCKTALAAGIAERQVRLAEQQGALIVGLLQRIFDDLDLSPAQRDLIPTVVPRHLRALA
jgi:hypothetical protein